MNNYKKQFNIIKGVLEIGQVVSIRFDDKKTKKYKQFEDTACTALARCLKNKTLVFIDREKGQLCSGAEYFLNIKKISDEDVCEVYVDGEQVFKNDEICNLFLKDIPKYPKKLNKKFILLSPLEFEIKKPDIVILLANSAQAGRILGLSVFKDFRFPHILPAGPTCLSLYAPCSINNIHLNFIDYYDRYEQCVKNGRSIFKDSEMIISLPFSVFNDIIECVEKSPHGLFKPNLKPMKVTKL